MINCKATNIAQDHKVVSDETWRFKHQHLDSVATHFIIMLNLLLG